MHSFFVLHIKNRIQKLIIWDNAVASAAPEVPSPRPKIKMGSRKIFKIPPVVIPIMENNAFPWKRSRLFMIKEHTIKGAAMKM